MKYVDIFSGCGGMSWGLHKAGFKGIFAIEKSEMAFETLKFNLIDKNKHFSWVDWLEKKAYDINDILENYSDKLEKLKDEIELVVGGPPCQGFSMAGRRDESDLRNSLIHLYIEFIDKTKPKYLLFENVRGFSIGFKKLNGERGKAYSEHVLEQLDAIGYNVDFKIINFADFGVPQRRQRVIIFGIRKDVSNKNDFFERLFDERETFLKNKGLPLNKNVTVKQAISDLLKANGTLNSKEFSNFLEGKYKKARGSNYQLVMKKDLEKELPDSHRFPNHNLNTESKFKIFLKEAKRNVNVSEELKKKFNLKKHCITPLCENSDSPTLTTLPDDYIHYCEPRILTVREYARLQSFSDDFEFKGKYTTGGKLRKIEVPRYTQIGNAIPPFFGEIAGIVIDKWNEELQKKKSSIKISETIKKEVLA